MRPRTAYTPDESAGRSGAIEFSSSSCASRTSGSRGSTWRRPGLSAVPPSDWSAGRVARRDIVAPRCSDCGGGSGGGEGERDVVPAEPEGVVDRGGQLRLARFTDHHV